MDYVILGLLIFILLLAVGLIIKIAMTPKQAGITENLERLERIGREDARHLREELSQSLLQFNDSIRKSVEDRLDRMSAQNTEKLEQMRTTVDEKLHTTLEKRLGESFSQVSERLEKVHQGLGEMQNLASDVGGLKRVLTNVKTRGTWGEVQLGTLLEQMLSPEQFIKNAHIRDNSAEVVEFAVRLPEGLIPIDSKFPMEDYERLMDASERADIAALELAGNELEKQIKLQAKLISEKYICPPKTIDLGIMFLPTESLYAEVIRRPGLAGGIQSKYRVAITGPSTLTAVLNSLQMGFRTLAIQKRSGEVWSILGEAKAEFEKYADWVNLVKKNIDAAHRTLDAAETRTRAVSRKLRAVETTPLSSPAGPLEEAQQALLTPEKEAQ